jgi:hypothetical protein
MLVKGVILLILLSRALTSLVDKKGKLLQGYIKVFPVILAKTHEKILKEYWV